MTDFTLHGYFRSGASYRVRIALNLKGVPYADVFHHLRKGEQREPGFLALNPQGFVPALEAEGDVLTQSLAICEYLDELFPDPPLLPATPLARAKVRAAAQLIACDVHPVQNLRVLKHLREVGLTQDQATAWAARVIGEGLDAFEALIGRQSGPYCFGDRVTLADLCLVPQLGNARRFGVELVWPRILEVERACLALDAFRRAAPENQPDAE
ncbi:maleylacetoacetate isomerase [Sphingobium amiense]|uniref:Maleylacetoacetate isomerase n=1 Tax=Sphingobium amiense TaxID=135719 RepID=A0A494WEV5_9SPHN|nr:maleylacetoacetate isomerase [Sphingobium amiense]BBD99480.1 maleylacetoacetate isomerase [Sphingobium amiense]